jgi:hypothetical protein
VPQSRSEASLLDSSHEDGEAPQQNLHAVFVLTSLLFDGHTSAAILDMAAEAVSSIVNCCTETAYRMVDGSLVDNRDSDRPLDSDLDVAVAAGIGSDQEIALPDAHWRYVITLRTLTTVIGAMVMRAEEPVPCHEFVLLKVLAQQTAAAMAGADLIDSERRQRFRLRELTDQH